MTEAPKEETRAAVVSALEEDLSGVGVKSHPLPPLAPEQVQVAIKAAALNFPDLLMCSGGYQLKPELPFALGMEAAGIVVEVGALVKDFRTGDEVICAGRSGLCAEKVNLEPAQLSLKPKALDWASAASYRVAWMTALTALKIGKLQKGESLLVLGASGGVGLAAVDVGVKLGARVFAVASSEEKRALTKAAGAAQTFAPDGELPALVKEATGGKGVQVVYDPVGGELFNLSLRCLEWQGRMLVIGFASGVRPTLAVNYALIKGLSIIGVRAGEFGRRNPEAGAKIQQQLLEWAKAGAIKPHIGARFKLDEIKEALLLMKDRKALGKICILME